MFRNKFYFKNVVAIAICLAGTTVFSSCDSGGSGQEPEIPLPSEQVLTGLQMLAERGNEYIPISWDAVSWEKDASGKFIKYDGYDVNYWDNNIRLTKLFNYTGTLVYDTIQIMLDNGRIKQKQDIVVTVFPNNSVTRVVGSLNYYYDEQGFLVRVTRGEQDKLQITVRNGNVTQIKTINYSYTGEVNQTITYNYSYDNNVFVPMNDWAPYTPLYVVESRVTLYDNLLGKKSKNNVVNVDIQYQESEYQAHFNKLTYELEYNEQNKLAAIKHTGRYTTHFLEGSNQVQVDFGIVKTLFKYTDK